MQSTQYVYEASGFCPICSSSSVFISKTEWYRDNLFCSGCKSIPRERALALVLEKEFPNWRNLKIHESSPAARGISLKLMKDCREYIASQFFSDQPLGSQIHGVRNENIENTTFDDDSFDLIITLDVMEHVNYPEKVFAEVKRTLKKNGAYLFTVPTYKHKVESERRALYTEAGVEFYAEPEYHGNPISDKGSLVTFHYGYDLAELINKWSGLDVEVRRFHDHKHGIIGEFTEVYLARN